MARKPKAEAPKPTGRPSSFTQEIGDLICERLSEGESLRGICSSPDMPHKATVFRWLAQDDAFRDQYARAREAQADAIFDEILHIADTPLIGKKTKTSANGVEVQEGDMIEHRRLQVEARKWMAGKLKPKVYGDKQAVELSNPDGTLAPITGFDIRIAHAPASNPDAASG